MKETRTPQDIAFANLDRATNTQETKILATSPGDDRESHGPHGFEQHVEVCIVRKPGFRRKFESRACTKTYVNEIVVDIIDVSAKLSGVLLSWLQPDDRSIIVFRPLGAQRCSSERQCVKQLLKQPP